MADSFNKKEREKKRRKRKQDKAEKRKQKKLEGGGQTNEFMYLDADGNLVATQPDPSEKVEIELEEIEISIPKKSDEDDNDFIRDGVIKFFNQEKRFGFITDQATGQDYFVHADNVDFELREGGKVTFEIGSGPKGLIAINVKQQA